jgi:endonuclease III-like uncharacterized protein
MKLKDYCFYRLAITIDGKKEPYFIVASKRTGGVTKVELRQVICGSKFYRHKVDLTGSNMELGQPEIMNAHENAIREEILNHKGPKVYATNESIQVLYEWPKETVPA